MKQVCFKIPEDDLRLIDEYAMNHRLSRSDVVRMALEQILSEVYGKHKEHERRLRG